MDDFKESVKRSFSACKTDIESLKTENLLLKEKFSSLESENSSLKSQLLELQTELKGLKIALDYIRSEQSNLSSRAPSQQTQKLNSTSNNFKIQEVKKEVKAEKDPYEALLEFKARANKREILKQKMVSMIGETKMNLSELKFMFVDHFKYCSKATFYNYLKELELEKIIKIEREHSKNFVYNLNLSNQIDF